jgi:hypothetical protein
MLKAQVPNFIPKEGLKGWYPLDGNANSLVTDSMKNGQEYFISYVEDRKGNPNKAAYFGTDSSHIIIDSALKNLNINKPVSFAFWLKTTPDSDPDFFKFNRRMVEIEIVQGIMYFGIQQVDVNVLGLFNYRDFFLTSNIYDTAHANNEWNHISCVFSDSMMYIYKNGSLVTSDYILLPTFENPELMAGRPAILGGSLVAFKGMMDDLGFWEKALTETEVMQMYAGYTTSLSKVEDNGFGIQVYPNPVAEGIIHVRTADNSPIDLLLFDIAGKLIEHKSGVSNEFNWNVNSLNSGVYTLVANSKEGKSTHKIVMP